MAGEVRLLRPDDEADVVDVMCEAFRDYPVMRYVVGPVDDYERKLNTLVTMFVHARVLRGEWMFGIASGRGLEAAATISRPYRESPPEVDEARARAWSVLGDDARERYETFSRANRPFEVEQPHLYVSLIGVRERSRGLGLAGRLLDATHALSAEDEESEGVTLTTEVERNISFYQHFGYEVVGQARVADAFTTWGFYRADGVTEVIRR